MITVNPKIDIVFKKIFGTEENKDLLISLINSIIPEEEKIKEVVLKNPYNEVNFKDDKLSIVDIKATDEKGRWYNIEIQLKEQFFYGRRALFYWSKMYSNQVVSGEEYESLCKTISINLLDFNYFEDDRYVRRCTIKDFDTNEIYQNLDYADWYFVELRKFPNDLKHVKTALDRWIAFLNLAHSLDKRNFPEELSLPEIKKAYTTTERMYFSEEEREYYSGKEKFIRDEKAIIKTAIMKSEAKGIKIGMEKGMEKGLEKGLEKGKLEIAKSMLQKGFSAEQVSELTGLNKEQIEIL